MIDKQESILYITHQAWKYDASMAVDWLGIIIAAGSFYYSSSYPQWYLPCLTIAGILFIIGFFIALRIKCPNCGALWYWLRIRLGTMDSESCVHKKFALLVSFRENLGHPSRPKRNEGELIGHP